MIVSPAEAIGILRKWAVEAIPVSVILTTDGMSVVFTGFIYKGLSNALVIRHSDYSGKTTELTVGLEMMEEFSYQDSREAPVSIREQIRQKAASCLILKSSGAICYIYESPSLD